MIDPTYLPAQGQREGGNRDGIDEDITCMMRI